MNYTSYDIQKNGSVSVLLKKSNGSNHRILLVVGDDKKLHELQLPTTITQSIKSLWTPELRQKRQEYLDGLKREEEDRKSAAEKKEAARSLEIESEEEQRYQQFKERFLSELKSGTITGL